MSTPSLLITPERFQLVLGVNEDCSVELNNVGYEAIIFRLLTTSPDRYIVRHTKGVIRGNSSMRATIALNRNYKFEEENKNGVKVVKDDFRIEYTLLGENDVIEAKFNNVPALIKEKKNESPASVLKKMIRCHLLLDPNASDASTARDDKKDDSVDNTPNKEINNNNNNNNNTLAARGAAQQLESKTLDAKNLRKEAGGAVQKTSQPAAKGSRVKLIIAAALILLLLLWLLLD